MGVRPLIPCGAMSSHIWSQQEFFCFSEDDGSCFLTSKMGEGFSANLNADYDLFHNKDIEASWSASTVFSPL